MFDYIPRVTKIHRCLNQVKSLAGAERGFVIVNATICLATVMGLKTLIWVPVAFAIHIFLVWLFKNDPMTRLIYKRYNQQGDRYDPWPRANVEINDRPEGFDKGNLC